MIVRALIFLVSVMAGLWCSTQMLAARVQVSGELFSIAQLKVYPPWLWAEWFFYHGDRYHTAWPIYVSIAVGVGLAWVSRFFLNAKQRSTAHGSSRWAYEREIKDAGLIASHGVVLGKSETSGKVLRHDGPEHVLAIAPTRGGKGVGLVIPTLLDWQHSAVVFDPKGENFAVTGGYRAAVGDVLCFEPTSRSTSCFNPLMEIRSGELAVKDAQNVADIIVDPDGRLEMRNHWQNAAHSLLVGVILHVVNDYHRKSLAGVVEFLTRPGVNFEGVLAEMLKSQDGVVASVAQEMLNKHEEERSGVLSTAISLLSIFRDPLVAHATDSHDFCIKQLIDNKRLLSLYLILPPSDLSRLRVLIRLMLNQMGRVLTEVQDNQQAQRVLFLLDEFPALGRLEFFESALAYMAGYGLKAFLICQSLNQLQKIYGERNAILDNCHVRVAFANNDDQTARRLSDLLGEQTMTKAQTSLSGGRFEMFKRNASVSNIEYGRPLMLPSEINRLPNEQEIVLVNGMFPIRANKIRYYADGHYQSKLKAAPVRKPKPTAEPIKSIMPVVGRANNIGSAL